MTVAIDGTPLTLSSGGLRRYTEELVSALRAEFPEDRFDFVSDQLEATKLGPIRRRWWLLGLPLELLRRRFQVFHGTDFSVPYLPVCPSVMTVHDLSPWLKPEWHRAAARVRRRTPLLLTFGLATLVITPTESIRKQVIDRFRIPPGRVFTIYEAASDQMRPSEPHPGRYFLFVGTIEPRKNIPLLVEAWREVRRSHPDVRLLLAGRCRADAPPVATEPGLDLLGEVPDAMLPNLYSGAIALVYPSAHEGFGLPIVEAMQCGSAVIASDDAALLEVSGGAALHAKADQLATAMLLLLENPEELWRRREHSARRARAFSWRQTARNTMEVYGEAIRRF
jgi:glycosyltransferase involved in cell wall biosynthesis